MEPTFADGLVYGILAGIALAVLWEGIFKRVQDAINILEDR